MNRRDLLKMLAAAMAAPYVGPATASDDLILDQLSVKPVLAASTSRRLTKMYTGPLFRVAGFGDVGEDNMDAFRAWVEENPYGETGIGHVTVCYNQVADSGNGE